MNCVNSEKIESLVAQYLQALELKDGVIQRSGVIAVDLMGLLCPEPLMMLRQQVRKGESGDLLLALATDPSTQRDIPAYCRFTGQILVHESVLKESPDVYFFLIQKG